MRYHKDVFFPENAKKSLEAFTASINNKTWKPSKHCLDNIQRRVLNLEAVLSYISGLRLEASNIFEYYTTQSEDIEKACFRIEYGVYDIILVVSDDKELITIYLNNKEDNHDTLKHSLYTKG